LFQISGDPLPDYYVNQLSMSSLSYNSIAMLLRKIVLSFGLVWLIQFNGSAQTGDSVNKALVLERVIYHAGPCNGICPTIDMIIDSNRDVYVRRTIWTVKGEPDKAHSGNFKGKIDRLSAGFGIAATTSAHDRRLGDRAIAGIAMVAVEGIRHVISIGEGKINARNIL
jgi:hypothetical protein